ncbi:MAG: hypothetical protein WD648_11680 [Planctomycetaceae bacterium]
MEDDNDVEFAHVSIGELRRIRELAKQIRATLAVENHAADLSELRKQVSDAILNGAKSRLFDRVLAASQSDLPQILTDVERFLNGHQAWFTRKFGDKQAKLRRMLEDRLARLPEQLDLALQPSQITPATQARKSDLGGADDVRLPPNELVKVRTINDIALYAEREFGWRPARSTLNHWIKNKSLRARRRGKIWEFSRSDLEALVQKRPSSD